VANATPGWTCRASSFLDASEQASRGNIATIELSGGHPLDNSAVTGSEPDDGQYAEQFFEAIERQNELTGGGLR
jgi:hypothetical protein